MADMMDRTINSILTAMIAVILVASAFIPTVVPMINNLLGETTTSQYGSLLSVVVVITIVGIIIGVIKMYTDHHDEYEED